MNSWCMAAWLACAAVGPAGGGHEVHSRAISGATADRDWSALEAVLGETPPESAGTDEAGFNRWMSTHTERVRTAALAFYKAHPQDARRWDAVARILEQASALAEIDGKPPSAQRQADWSRELEELRQALERSQDAGTEPRETAAAFPLVQAVMEMYSPTYAGDLLSLVPRLQAVAARFPDGPLPGSTLEMYLQMLGQRRPEVVSQVLHAFADSPNAATRSAARGRLALDRARTEPMEMKFTALDGREVDLAKLRGKVVLIDYWATWCKPCMAEMPQVKAAYDKYNERGFEVIGISLDEADARQKVIDTAARHGMRWPQYFSGQGWRNPYAERYAINSIPATFLLDRDGKLVATELRGEQLHDELDKRLAAP